MPITPTTHPWQQVARRIVEGLGVQPGEMVQVQSRIGRFEVMLEVLLAVEMAGAVPVPEITPAPYLRRLLSEASPDYLRTYDYRRIDLVGMYDRILNLQGDAPDLKNLPGGAEGFWGSIGRLDELEESRRLPVLLAAIPTARRARRLRMSLSALDAMLVSALAASLDELRGEIERVLAKVGGGREITVTTGGEHKLHLKLGNRRWLEDDGYISPEDRERGAIVSNLPAGSIYTTVLETETEGSIAIPKAGPGEGVVLGFRGGRVEEIRAQRGEQELRGLFDGHTGEPRRVSHFGIGLNPYLSQPLGWIIVDEHIHGNLFLALGENRYMGGENVSSLNIDFVIPGATVEVEGSVVVRDGKVIA
jgi:leucyl aminopeptidase (aminopeptidase T)